MITAKYKGKKNNTQLQLLILATLIRDSTTISTNKLSNQST